MEADRIINIAGTKGSKTESSVRKVFLPKTVSMALTEEKDRQQRAKEMLDSDYQDFGLVIAHEDGRPYEERQIAFLLRKLTDATGLPPVLFCVLFRSHHLCHEAAHGLRRLVLHRCAGQGPRRSDPACC